MKDIRLHENFQELSEDEAMSIDGGNSILEGTLSVISQLFRDITGLIDTPRAGVVNETAHGILDIIRNVFSNIAGSGDGSSGSIFRR